MAGLFRFSNAVSDISKFIQTYRSLYENFSILPEGSSFNHDDAGAFLALNGLASSQGAIGQTALERSRRPDRSRDPLYNQHKMYSEIYRMLGWYEPGTMQTNFRMTEFGEYVYSSIKDSNEERNLFALNILHIASPNAMTEVRGQNILRPFPLILRLALRLGGCICRDEIILGVLACNDDRVPNIVDTTAEYILSLRRQGKGALETAINALNKDNGFSTAATSQNYTRFPIAAMKWTGWAEGINMKGIYGNTSMAFLRLTPSGTKIAQELEDAVDIRMEDIKSYSPNIQASFIMWSNLHQLEMLGYDLSDYALAKKQLQANAALIFNKFGISNTKRLLFFGYQEAPRSLLRMGDQILENL